MLHNDPKHKWEFNTKWKLGQLSKRSTKSIYLFISIFILSTSQKRISKFENSLSYKETTVTHTGECPRVGQVRKKKPDKWPKVNKDPEELPYINDLYHYI